MTVNWNPPATVLKVAAEMLADPYGQDDEVVTWMRAVAAGEPAEDVAGTAMAIVLTLASCEPPLVWDGATRPHCSHCGVEPPGAAVTIPVGMHSPGCPWRRAVEFADNIRT